MHFCIYLFKNRDQNSYLKCPHVVEKSIGVAVQFNDGCVILDGASMDVSKIKCFKSTAGVNPIRM